VTSGEECLLYLEDRERNLLALPILILLDLNTPKGDGREALRAITGNDRLRGIPLVVLSASGNARDVGFCYKHGANAYHLKPVSHPAHLQILQIIFSYWLLLPFYNSVICSSLLIMSSVFSPSAIYIVDLKVLHEFFILSSNLGRISSLKLFFADSRSFFLEA
jgi:CheY-like chemotaxis protein